MRLDEIKLGQRSGFLKKYSMSKRLWERQSEETEKQKIVMINTLPDNKEKKFKQLTNCARLSEQGGRKNSQKIAKQK